MQRIITSGIKALRAVAGRNTPLEEGLRRLYWGSVDTVTGGRVGKEHVVFGSRRRSAPRLGIYAFGSCDLPSVLACKPAILEAFNGSSAIFKAGKVSSARSDLVLQALDGHDEACAKEVVERVGLPESMFRAELFEPAVTLDLRGGDLAFPKDVVILSIAADLTRTLYRHRKTGLLIDPGGRWLGPQVQFALDDPKAIQWVAREFESIGRLTVEESMANLRRIVEEVRKRTGGTVVMFNMLTVEPTATVHTYQFLERPWARRVREFNLALWDLAQEIDLAVVDVDRVLKGGGLDGMTDFAHDRDGLFPRSHFAPLAAEVMRILHELDVFERAQARGLVGGS